MKKGLVELVFILDRSGSMSGLESDTIGGFNSLVEKQKAEEGEALVTTILFDSEIEVLHDRLPLAEVPPMTRKEYFVRGCTALLDAIGFGIEHIEKIHKYAREEDVPEHTLFVITTDGLENASRRFDSSAVKKLIEARKETGWDFLFLGANIDAVETAGSIGIHADRAADFHCDSAGLGVVFNAVGSSICNLRAAGLVGDVWKKDIDEDFRKRAKNGR
ncbi:MAG: VWA domain-containing protein [Desulfovibrionaceae bacterium]|nr:VWA domain-containing protein [Desulfovibrionaceae bacterium]